ncbi:hypothetical protein PybrP1_010644 [[Pythium] brassicae (nom. inval.)]|nr:hypothetical protein PybrP1_010644 [[Pythium] brassicae (nom. inval.)]
MNTVVFEANRLANFRVVRIIGSAPEETNQTFYAQCISAVWSHQRTKHNGSEALVISKLLYLVTRRATHLASTSGTLPRMVRINGKAVGGRRAQRCQGELVQTNVLACQGGILARQANRNVSNFEQHIIDKTCSQPTPTLFFMKAFTLWPTKKGFQASLFLMVTTSLHDLLRRNTTFPSHTRWHVRLAGCREAGERGATTSDKVLERRCRHVLARAIPRGATGNERQTRAREPRASPLDEHIEREAGALSVMPLGLGLEGQFTHADEKLRELEHLKDVGRVARSATISTK